MKQIRQNVFETNSSSTHVLSIEGFGGIKPLIKNKSIETNKHYGYFENLYDFDVIENCIESKEYICRQGISPIYAEPDLEDRKYTWPISKVKLLWTYLVQRNVVDDKLFNFLNVLAYLNKKAEKYVYNDWKNYGDVKEHGIELELYLWASQEFLETLLTGDQLNGSSDRGKDSGFYPWIAYDKILFCSLSDYEQGEQLGNYSDKLSGYRKQETVVNWQSKPKKGRHVYKETKCPKKEWGVFMEHYLSKEVEVLNEILDNPKVLKAVILNSKCIIWTKRIG